jgi:hypothetical protein
MDFPLQLFVLSLPSIAYLIIKRYRNANLNDILKELGLQGPELKYYFYAMTLVIITGVSVSFYN